MKTLFIGGYADGKWIDIEKDRDYVSIPEATTLIDVNLDKDEVFNIHEYKRQRLMAGWKEYYVMLWMDEKRDLIDLIISAYKRGEQP